MPSSKKVIFMLALSSILTIANSASTLKQACLLEGDFTMGEERVIISDCAQNLGIPQEEFHEACVWMSNPFGDDRYAATVTFLESCPTESQAKCQNAMNGNLNFFYYKRDAQMLETTKSSCQMLGGEWIQ
jgi:hypothetical protein